MMSLSILGSGSSYNPVGREATMLAVAVGNDVSLVDCGGNALATFIRMGGDPAHVARLFLTHNHPDHVVGFPLLVQQLWLAGRQAPLPVYAPSETVVTARRLLETFDTSGWEGLFEIEWHTIPLEPRVSVCASSAVRVMAAPAQHSRPTVALRFESEHGVLVYSSDTAPALTVVELARGADLLVHEATGAYDGHSTVEEAVMVARDAGVSRVVLVHLPYDEEMAATLAAQAQAETGVPVIPATDEMRYLV
nr:MBL fold metallo-hydrolase [Ardenticatena sp.]